MANRKSQIQMFETMAVLIVFFVLLGIGFIFYTKVVKSNIESGTEEISQSKSVAIAQRVMFLPEVQCSEDNVARENCIDTKKLDAAISIINNPANQLYYYDLFEFSEIKIDEIYPGSQHWDLYSRTASDYKNKFQTRVPVTLFDPVTKTSKFGIIGIITYTK